MVDFNENETIKVAYGLFLTFEDSTLFDDLQKRNAEKTVDIAVKYKGITKEFSRGDFFSMLGFESV